MAYQNPQGQIYEIVSGNIDVIVITSVPDWVRVVFSPNLPNEPLYPESVARYRYLITRGQNSFATPWVTCHANTNMSIRPVIRGTDQIELDFVPEIGVQGFIRFIN